MGVEDEVTRPPDSGNVGMVKALQTCLGRCINRAPEAPFRFEEALPIGAPGRAGASAGGTQNRLRIRSS